MDTSETELEKIIVDWLRDKNGYEQASAGNGGFINHR